MFRHRTCSCLKLSLVYTKRVRRVARNRVLPLIVRWKRTLKKGSNFHVRSCDKQRNTIREATKSVPRPTTVYVNKPTFEGYETRPVYVEHIKCFFVEITIVSIRGFGRHHLYKLCELYRTISWNTNSYVRHWV